MSILGRFNFPDPDGWADQAICKTVDPEIFDADDGLQHNEAKRICTACPVRAECLAHAMDNNEVGIWGGTSTYDRQLLRRGVNPIRGRRRR